MTRLFDRRAWQWIGVAAFLSGLLRLRFVWSPLTADEGGYMAIGRAWFDGAMLYRDHWIDRPQGLLGLFGTLDLFTGGSTAAIRLMAIVFGCLGVLGAALVGRALGGAGAQARRSAIGAAFMVAVLSSVAQFEGFIANGELLGGSLAVLCLGVGLSARSMARPMRWYLAAGVIGGLAMSMRQTSLDGLAIIVLAAVFSPLLGIGRPERRRAVVAVVGGAVAVLGIQIVHGVATDSHAFWYCMWGYRSQHRDISSADWPRFWRTFGMAWPIFLPELAVGAVLIVEAIRRQRRAVRTETSPRWALLAAWLLIVMIMFAWGGQFYHHYWVMLTFPVGVIVGVALATLSVPRLAIGLGALCSVAPVVATTRLVLAPVRTILHDAHEDGRLVLNEKVADWYNNRKQSGDSLAVLCGSAPIYALTHTTPPISPIWIAALKEADGAIDKTAATLNGNGPSYLAVFGGFSDCDEQNKIGSAVGANYVKVANVAGVTMMQRRPASPGGP